MALSEDACEATDNTTFVKAIKGVTVKGSRGDGVTIVTDWAISISGDVGDSLSAKTINGSFRAENVGDNAVFDALCMIAVSCRKAKADLQGMLRAHHFLFYVSIFSVSRRRVVYRPK